MKINLSPVYQTISNQGKPKYTIETLGPIYCVNNPWLGNGYYFWDGFIELAHWWGNKHYAGNYIICQANLNFEDSEYYDLVGNTFHLRCFKAGMMALKAKLKCNNLTVSAVLAEFRKHSDNFHYKVIRARSEHHIEDSENVRFVEDDRGYMITIPAIQICVTDLKIVENYQEICRFPDLHVI